MSAAARRRSIKWKLKKEQGSPTVGKLEKKVHPYKKIYSPEAIAANKKRIKELQVKIRAKETPEATRKRGILEESVRKYKNKIFGPPTINDPDVYGRRPRKIEV